MTLGDDDRQDAWLLTAANESRIPGRATHRVAPRTE